MIGKEIRENAVELAQGATEMHELLALVQRSWELGWNNDRYADFVFNGRCKKGEPVLVVAVDSEKVRYRTKCKVITVEELDKHKLDGPIVLAPTALFRIVHDVTRRFHGLPNLISTVDKLDGKLDEYGRKLADLEARVKKVLTIVGADEVVKNMMPSETLGTLVSEALMTPTKERKGESRNES